MRRSIDRDGVLWLTGEHYASQRPLSFHADQLPPGVTWYADPSGANEIAELRRANFTVLRGVNDLRLGITAVRARLEDGRLRIVEGRCPNLLAEAGMYRWGESEDRRAEVPVDENNHALAALRYLIATLDRNSLTKRLSGTGLAVEGPTKTAEELAAEERVRRYWEKAHSDDDEIWWPLG